MYREQIDMQRVPHHVAIIMDGNGRWAKQRGLQRSAGHQAGVETVKKTIELATRLGIKYITLYTFSTENWNRPKDEVIALMGLIIEHLEEEIFVRNNVRFNVIGDLTNIPPAVKEKLFSCMEHTKNNDATIATIALSYSSKWEITEAVKKIASEVKDGKMQIDDITDQTISDNLTTADMKYPDPDLLIRTGGEFRISNYMLWQCAYAEMYFCDTFWPDFDDEQFCKAIVEYQNRERRYGKTSEQIQKNDDAK
ncbi:MAG: isoprenyl transferase [Prevotellaceae bacterium]|nr:isoprenyl transferase [Candidatus Faecinaster equi]